MVWQMEAPHTKTVARTPCERLAGTLPKDTVIAYGVEWRNQAELETEPGYDSQMRPASEHIADLSSSYHTDRARNKWPAARSGMSWIGNAGIPY